MMNEWNSHREYTNEFFGSWLKLYDLVVWPLRPLRRKIAARIGGPGKKILDVACGTGEQGIALARTGAEVLGIDIARPMLARAKKKLEPGLQLQFEEMDATTLPFPNDSFDAATINLALHDMPQDMGISILREMKRVTKSGGTIIVTDYCKPRTIMGWLYHWQMHRLETRYYPSFMREGSTSILKEAGLAVVSRTPALFGILEVATVKSGHDEPLRSYQQ